MAEPVPVAPDFGQPEPLQPVRLPFAGPQVSRVHLWWTIDDYSRLPNKEPVSSPPIITGLPVGPGSVLRQWHFEVKPRVPCSGVVFTEIRLVLDWAWREDVTVLYQLAQLNSRAELLHRVGEVEVVTKRPKQKVVTQAHKMHYDLIKKELPPYDQLHLWAEIVTLDGLKEAPLSHDDPSLSLVDVGMPDVTTWLMSGLSPFLASDRYADIKLLIGAAAIPCHKAVLGAASSVLATMFKEEEERQLSKKETTVDSSSLDNSGKDDSLSNKGDSLMSVEDFDPNAWYRFMDRGKILEMRNVNHEVVIGTLQHFYNAAEIDGIKDLCWEMLHFADKLKCERLKEICSRELEQQLSADNASTILSIAHDGHAKELKKSVLTFTADCTLQVTSSGAWDVLMRDSPQLAKEVIHAAIGPAIRANLIEAERRRLLIGALQATHQMQEQMAARDKGFNEPGMDANMLRYVRRNLRVRDLRMAVEPLTKNTPTSTSL